MNTEFKKANEVVEVPYTSIEPEILRALIEDFICRDGTFYGWNEMPMEHKVTLVIGQFKSGDAVITWDLIAETSNIIMKEVLRKGTQS